MSAPQTVWDLRTGKALQCHEEGRSVAEDACEWCGRKLRGGIENARWIEITVDGELTFSDSPAYDPSRSQGCFAVGPDCYKKVLRHFAPWKLSKEDR